MRYMSRLQPQRATSGGLRLFLEENNRPVLLLADGEVMLSIGLNMGHLHDIAYFVAQCSRYAMDADAPLPEPVRIACGVIEETKCP